MREVIPISKFKKEIIIYLSVLVGLAVCAVLIFYTLHNGKLFTSFKASEPLKSNLKNASEIEYKDYVSDEDDMTDGIVSVEWVLHHWYEGFEPVTVFYEDVGQPEIDEMVGQYISAQRALIEYGKELLQTDDLLVTSSNIMDACTGCITVKAGERSYLICMCITDETGEGKCTVFHSEVISNETE